MQVTFVSQCEKKALARTRMVLDAFAERIGDNTWQTIITMEGLDAVHTELRKTASKSTAVACHWQRSRTRSQLVWIVGKRHEFNAEGQVPVNETGEETRKFMDKEKWKYLPLIRALATLAGIFHDWGKCNNFFQGKLKKGEILADPHRHEWLSVLFLKSLYLTYPNGDDWLRQLELGDFNEKKIRSKLPEICEEHPFQNIESTSLKLLMWLILSHHRMPLLEDNNYKSSEASDIDSLLNKLSVNWGYSRPQNDEKDLKKCYTFSNNVLKDSPEWLSSVKKYSKQLKDNTHLLSKSFENGAFRSVLHHARLSLMLADYQYSNRSENSTVWESNLDLFANTSAPKVLNQHLDNHLYYVAKTSGSITKQLPVIESKFSGIPPEKLLAPSPDKFKWQDIAVDKIRNAEQLAGRKSGFFAINLASTGCGKTIANAKIMAAAGEDDTNGLRFSVALGLRTLTLQTGDEYRNRLKLSSQELATVIGSNSIQRLHEQASQNRDNENLGSESKEELFSEQIVFTGDFDEKAFNTILTTEKSKQLLAAPALVCTIDHLMGATETLRGGRFILPSLRLLSSDIIFDEVDDFIGSDEIAIGRLIFLTGMLGRKVLLSSATIPPSMAEGFFQSYQKGWQIYARSHTDISNQIVSLWVDEFESPRLKNITKVEEYRNQHSKFSKKRVETLLSFPAKRKCNLIETPFCEQESDEEATYFGYIADEIVRKHEQHSTQDPRTGKSVSLGVIRVATIKNAVSLTRHLLDCDLEDGFELRVMAYHSRQTLLMRHKQELYLDSILKRKSDDTIFLKDQTINNHLDNSGTGTKNVAFVVVATPVEEVGRDHDFDWAIIEPSSFRSLIQMAGRIARHRDINPTEPNIGLLEYNFKAYKENDHEGRVYFVRPGYELPGLRLSDHSLQNAVDLDQLEERLDACPRMIASENKDSLIGIEHISIKYRLCDYDQINPNSLSGYVNASWWLTGMPQIFHPFRKSSASSIYCLILNPDTQELYFSERIKGKFARLENGKPAEQTKSLNIQFSSDQETKRLWLNRDYKSALSETAQIETNSATELSEIYGEVPVSVYGDKQPKFFYDDQLGLYER